MYVIEGFDRRNPDAKAVKVKIEQRINNLAFGPTREKSKLRGKSATPEKIADYLADHIAKVIKEIEPRLTHKDFKV